MRQKQIGKSLRTNRKRKKDSSQNGRHNQRNSKLYKNHAEMPRLGQLNSEEWISKSGSQSSLFLVHMC